MNDRIFIRENEAKTAEGGESRKRLIMVAGAIALVALLALGGYLVASSGSDSNTTDNSVNSESTPSENTEDTVAEDTDLAQGSDPESSEDSDEPEPEEPEAEETSIIETGPPTDPTKLHIYFPKSPETDNNPENLIAVVRDKPNDSLTTFVLVEVLTGPNSEERNAGYKSTWQFSGSSKCTQTNGSFRYEISGSTIKVVMCKDFTGSDINLYHKALEVSLIELGQISKVELVDYNGNSLI